jgi:hypothetical protein
MIALLFHLLLAQSGARWEVPDVEPFLTTGWGSARTDVLKQHPELKQLSPMRWCHQDSNTSTCACFIDGGLRMVEVKPVRRLSLLRMFFQKMSQVGDPHVTSKFPWVNYAWVTPRYKVTVIQMGDTGDVVSGPTNTERVRWEPPSSVADERVDGGASLLSACGAEPEWPGRFEKPPP